MTWQELMMDIFERIAASLAQVLDGLNPDELNLKPTPDTCSIGFISWRLTRILDRDISELMGLQQLWNTEKWYVEFRSNSDPAETGTGFRIQEMQDFVAPDAITIMKYHHDVLDRIRDFLGGSISEVNLEESNYSPTLRRRMPVYRRISGLVSDGLQLVGQAFYLRGLIHGYEWQNR
ncbi:MAG: hypothetical protein JW712_09570 [Dehalococcoidales bacterium]|nr:hypothetical protein [Dehalococcoidales bacterium]